MSDLPSLGRLNCVQGLWMRLDARVHPMSFQERVLAAMAIFPNIYLNVDEAQTRCNVIWDGVPLWSEARPMAEGLRWLKATKAEGRNVRLDVAWCGNTGRWVALKGEA